MDFRLIEPIPLNVNFPIGVEHTTQFYSMRRVLHSIRQDESGSMKPISLVSQSPPLIAFGRKGQLKTQKFYTKQNDGLLGSQNAAHHVGS